MKMNAVNESITIEISPRITGVWHLDGSGESIGIMGHFLEGRSYKGQYNGHTRTGFIEIEFDTR